LTVRETDSGQVKTFHIQCGCGNTPIHHDVRGV